MAELDEPDIAAPGGRRPTEAETLLAVSQAVGSTLELQEVVRRATRALVRALGADTGGTWGLSPDQAHLVPLAGYHVPKELLALPSASAIPARHPLMELVRRLGAVYASDSRSDHRFDDSPFRDVSHHSVLIQPMWRKGAIVGCFVLLWIQEPHTFTPGELRLADGIARQAAIAIENARLYGEAERRRREAEVIAGVARTINASLDLDTVLQRVAEAAKELTASDMARIALWDSDRETAVMRYRVGVRPEKDAALRVEPGKGAGGLVLATGRPFRTADYAADPRISQDYVDLAREVGVVAEMVVPVSYGGEVQGLLYVANRSRRPFTDWDQAALVQLGEQAAVAIQNGRLYEAAERRRRAAESLSDIGRLISRSLDPEEVQQRTADSVRLMLGADRATLFRLDREAAPLRVVASSGAGSAPGVAVVAGLAVRDRRPVVTPDRMAAADRAVIAVPLLVGSRVIGALEVHDRVGRRFDPEEVRLLQAFADQAAIALENARLYAETTRLLGEHQRKVEELSRAYDELSRTQDQLAQAKKMEAIGRLAGGIAHDFNNLLTVIKGRSQLLLHRLGADDPLRRHVVLVEETADRATALTRQLLAFSRKQVLEPRVLDLNAVVEGVQKMLRRLIGEDIELSTVLAPDLGAIRADPGQIEQVIVNLVVNARDAMPGGGTLAIETANLELAADDRPADVAPGAYVRLSVSDTGVGMTPGTRARLFEPFFTTKEVGKGTGLGLATVYGIIKQSGGGITVRSELGAGSRFDILLPRVSEAIELPVGGRLLADAPGGNETVLLVEDEDSVRDLAREILEMSGYRVLEARDGAQALGLAERHEGQIALLLTDVVMPGMNGAELARRLIDLQPRLKVLYVSGYADRGLGLGEGPPAATLLQKPFTPWVLAGKVRDVLDGRGV